MTLVNGEERETVSVSNRGLAYGDGVFTTVKVTGRRPQLWERHLRRLTRDCAKLSMAFDPAALEREVETVCAHACAPAAGAMAMKIILTRGAGARGYRPPSATAERIVQIEPWQPPPEEYVRKGVVVTVCRLRLAHALAGIKHLNRLEQVLARAEWEDEYPEGLMLDTEGRVIEGTMSNLFVVAGNELRTPMLDRCGVAGVMREHLIENARIAGFSVRETRLELEDLHGADGAFLCNALIGAWPIAGIGERDPGSDAFIAGRFRSILEITEEKGG